MPGGAGAPLCRVSGTTVRLSEWPIDAFGDRRRRCHESVVPHRTLKCLRLLGKESNRLVSRSDPINKSSAVRRAHKRSHKPP